MIPLSSYYVPVFEVGWKNGSETGRGDEGATLASSKKEGGVDRMDGWMARREWNSLAWMYSLVF